MSYGRMATQPCPCGYFGSPDRPCNCGMQQVQRYRGRVSGPILDTDRPSQESSVETAEEPEPVADKKDPKESIQADKVVCLECGAEMRQLTVRHLQGHGLSLRDYRQKYGFSVKQPLSAKSLTKMRSRLAKKRGLPENLKKYLEAKRQEKVENAAAPEEIKETAPARRTRKKA